MNFTKLERIKGEHQDHSTRQEVATVLGVHPQTVKRWRREGKVPQPAQTASNGWALWSPEQVQRMIKERTNQGSR